MEHGNALRAFIGSFTSAGGRGIVTAAVDPATGALTETAATDAVADPSYLAVGKGESGPVLYAVSETEEGAVAAFDVRGGGPPRPLGAPVPVNGSAPTHLSLVPGLLLTANYGSGSVSSLPLGPGGLPGPAVGVLRHQGRGPHPERQREPHAHQVLPDPTGRWVLTVDLGTDSVRVCALDPAGGAAPVLHSETALPPGTGPRHLAFHPAGEHVYVLGELRPALTVCRWDARRGTLEPLGEACVLPDGYDPPSHASALAVSRGGRFLWAANRGHDSIAVLRLGAGGDEPEHVTTVHCGGHWPRDLVLGPTGTRLYAANERSGDVTWFDIDAGTGVPHRTGSLAVPAASCVVFA
ncbi:lactonase family protein [Streptomyces sp. NPDC058991]|uniref:lactonase family protein n=1 Tax=Streptomyces sp. NPDC058991 TaxID=3346687 RepID=UPI003692ADA2